MMRTFLTRYAAYPFAVQSEQLGKGHAVLSAEDKLHGSTDGLGLLRDMPILARRT
jgi:bifunctional N-acetylglucosamine-1-phosphate-uridyltransferase/glucosamine-1-phosphate-acetyltransferase GlmU-like protein